MDCSVQVQIGEGSRKEKWIECSSQCALLCTVWFKMFALVCIMDRVFKSLCCLCTVLFKMFALVCIMDCSHLWHGGAYWFHQFKF